MDNDAEMETVALPEDEISPEETELAVNLRHLCDRFGMERREKLEESADVLFSLGKLYLEKNQKYENQKSTKSMLQKLTYIRCSALLNAAKVHFNMIEGSMIVGVEDPHFELFCDTLSSTVVTGVGGQIMMGGLKKLHKKRIASQKSLSQINEVDEALVKLHSSILRSAGVKTVGGGEILRFSMKLLSEIKRWREEAKKRVTDIPIHESSIKAKEKEKIEKVRSENLKNTEQYLNLVKKISKKVKELLGTPPCKFAIVGLGSLARQEITPYSDFEHIIVLDDKVQQKSDDKRQAIMEYFRWFSIIFQVIMIGFGETFIPSVSIKSLNDYYASDKSKNWFYDAYTPCGIAFDGMIPQACKTPFSRQQAKEKRKHVVELIQPATKMAKFITHDEEIKNGCYLYDILASTCFVYGNDEVYKVYSTEVRRILKSIPAVDIFLRQQEECNPNHNEAVSNMYHADDHLSKYDIKAEVYRPITTLLGCYGRMNGIDDECSSFDIISRLQKENIITADFAHDLEYANAVACEARIKIYGLSGGKRNAMTRTQYAAIVGKESAIKCSKVMADLRSALAGKTDSDEKVSRSRSEFSVQTKKRQEANLLMDFGYFNHSITLAEEVIEWCENNALQNSTTDILSTILDAKYVVMKCYFHLASSKGLPRDEYRRLCETLCVDMLQCDDEKTAGRYRPMCVETLCRLYAAEVRPREFIEMFDLWKRYYHGINLSMKKSFVSQLGSFDILSDDFEMRQIVTEWDKMLKYLQNELEEEYGMNSRLLVRCHIAIVHIRLGQRETVQNGRKELLSVLTEIIPNARCIGKSAYVKLLGVIAAEQCRQGWKYDHSITYLEQHLVKKTTALEGEKESCQPLQETEDEFLYEEICRWRKENDLPLEYHKLNIWDEYERKSPYSPPMKYSLRDVKDLHAKTLPIKGKGRLVDIYNEAANNLFLMKIPESATALWRILHNCDRKEHNILKQAVALMFFMLQRQVQGFYGGTASSLHGITSGSASPAPVMEPGLQTHSSLETTANSTAAET